MPRERGDSGRYVETVALDDVLTVFERVDGPVVTSSDVAETLDCSRETARRKLGELGDRGLLEGRETAGRVVWWRAEEPVRHVDPEDEFWDAKAYEGAETRAAEIDDVLYGEIGGE